MSKLRVAFVIVFLAGLVGVGLVLGLPLPWSAPSEDSPATTMVDAPRQASAPSSSEVSPPQRTVAEEKQPKIAAASVLGLVLDARGEPVGGVQVLVSPTQGGSLVPLAVSDALGRVSTANPSGISQLDVAAPWVALALRSLGPESDPAAPLAVVAPGRPQRMLVRDEHGATVPRAEASLRVHGLVDFPRVLDDTWERTWKTVEGDADGVHRWALVPLASTFVTVRKPGYLPATVPIIETTPQELVVTLRAIAKGARLVSGVVTDARGAFVHGATVGLAERRATTDAYGAYQLIIEPGASVNPAAALFAASVGYYPSVVEGFGARVADRKEGVLTQDLQLLRPSVTVSGRVVDAQGAPVANVHVYPWRLALLSADETAEDLAAPPERKPLSLTGNLVRAFDQTGDDGRFTLPGLDRRGYRIRLYHRQEGWAWTTQEIVGGTQDVVVRLPDGLMGEVAGTVVTKDGLPAADVDICSYVEVYANGGGVASAGLPAVAKTDADGRFRIARMPRAGVTLAFGGAAWVDDQRRLDDVDLAALRVVLHRRCHVRVQLADPAWARAQISFFAAAGEILAIHEHRASGQMSTSRYALHDGKSEVIAVSETAATMRVRDGEKERSFPVALRAGEVNTLSW